MCRHLAVGPTCCPHIRDIPSQVRMAGGKTRIILVNILTNKHLHNHNPNKRRLVTLTCPEPKVTIIGRFVPRNSWMLYWWQNSKIRALRVPLIQFHTAHWRQGDASLEPLTLIQKLHFESIWTGSLCGASWSSWLYINWIICRNQCYISQWTWNLSSNLTLNTIDVPYNHNTPQDFRAIHHWNLLQKGFIWITLEGQLVWGNIAFWSTIVHTYFEVYEGTCKNVPDL
jgi:hypothetical protein